MENIYYFFRNRSEQSNFIVFGKSHIVILFIALLGSFFILKKKKESRGLELFIGSVLILQQLTLYTWYLFSNYNLLKDGLPLYHCRIAILFIGIGLILNKSFFIRIGSYWGIVGSIVALLSPSLDSFLFPHITQFSFFIGHLFLLWGSIYILFVKKIGMEEKELMQALVFTNTYHLLMIIVNKTIGSNYAYITTSPIGIGNELNPSLYSLIIIMIFNIILGVEFVLMKKYSKIDESCEVQYT